MQKHQEQLDLDTDQLLDAVTSPSTGSIVPIRPSSPARVAVRPRQVPSSRVHEQMEQRIRGLKLPTEKRRDILMRAKKLDVITEVGLQVSANRRASKETIVSNVIAEIHAMQTVEHELADDPSFDAELWAIAKSDTYASGVELMREVDDQLGVVMRELRALTDNPDDWVTPTFKENLQSFGEDFADGFTFGSSRLRRTRYELSGAEVLANFATLGTIAKNRYRQLLADQEAERLARRRSVGLEPEEVVDV